MLVSCSTCNGTGFRLGDGPCGVCHGTGIDHDPPLPRDEITITLSDRDCHHLVQTGAYNHLPRGIRGRIAEFLGWEK
jgi:DnaJ-class molecular chaperone